MAAQTERPLNKLWPSHQETVLAVHQVAQISMLNSSHNIVSKETAAWEHKI